MSDVQKTITDAFNKGSLCGLHIDLQKSLWSRYEKETFDNAFITAATLEQLTIPNFWVVIKSAPFCVMTAGQFIKSLSKREKSLLSLANEIPSSDIILPKHGSDLFNKPPFSFKDLITGPYDPFDYLTVGQNKDTFLLTGGKAYECVTDTVCGGIKKAFEKNRNIKFIVVEGAINYNDGDIIEYINHLKKRCELPDQNNSIMHTTKSEVAATLGPLVQVI